jgi:predicted transglutaminase-like cysteine proteinase
MPQPPDLWGWTPTLMDAPDQRWLAVKDEKCQLIHVGPPVTAVEVDRLINDTIAYRSDIGDTWFEPWRTMRSGAGDCEDFAILKRAALIENGFPDDRIFFLLVTDLVARCDHAVLLVHDDVWRLLDCRRSLSGGALPVEMAADFVPKRAMQGDRQWVYERRRIADG